MVTTRQLCLGVFAFLTAAALFGCGSDKKTPEKCPAGVAANQVIHTCKCGDAGALGSQTCQMDMTLTECDCTPGGGGASGTGGGAGSMGTGNGGTTGGGSGSTGGGSGTGSNDDDAGTAGGAGTTGGGAGTGGGGSVKRPPADGSALSTCDPAKMDSCDMGLTCYTGGGATSVGFCTKTCTIDDDCTSQGKDFTCSTSTGGGFPGGGGGGGTQACRQTCTGTDDKSCPEYMSCQAVTGGFRCLYDEKDVGKGTAAQWEECTVAGDCQGDLVCYGSTTLSFTSNHGFCTEACMATDDCKAKAPKGDATYECDTNAGWCRLNCAPDLPLNDPKTCPDGMTCATLGGGTMRCVYPTNSSGGI